MSVPVLEVLLEVNVKLKYPSAWERRAMVKGMDLVEMALFVWIIFDIIRASLNQVLPEKTAQ